MRDAGELTLVESLPEGFVVVFALVTQLADTWFLFALLAGIYWFADRRLADHPRRVGAVAIALVVCALAAVMLGKASIAVARPETTPAIPTWLPGILAELVVEQTDSAGFGFPSGHATGATVAYGALALLSDRLWSLRRRVAVAIGIVVVVSFSRLVLQVHYLVDVLAGTVLGIAVLAGGLWLAGDERVRAGSGSLTPTPVFLLAALVAAGAVAVAAASGHTKEAVEAGIGVGTALGGAVGWRAMDGDELPVPPRVALPTIVVTGVGWVGLFVLRPPILIAIVVAGGTVAMVLAAPALAERIDARF